MSSSTLVFNQVLSWLVFFSNILVAITAISLIGKKFEICWKFLTFLKKYAFNVAFLFALAGVLGSLIYSEFIGFEPCLLCWIQRIFLYPLAILFSVALVKREKISADYILSLAIPGALVAFYHYFSNQFGGFSITECTGPEGSCSIVYFTNLGYVTIPFMAFSTFALIVVLMLVEKTVKN